MLPSFRHYLKFIDLHTTFDVHGFTRKNGAAFKMNPQNREGCKYTDRVQLVAQECHVECFAVTDFLAVGEENYAWNVIRSEADELLFRHAETSGAKVYDGVKVSTVVFQSEEAQQNGHVDGVSGETKSNIDGKTADPGRAVSATWVKKQDGSSGVIRFDYIVDASGRTGLLSTKYLKNRHFSTALKNVAHWAYFTGGGLYGAGSRRANAPFFEALRGEKDRPR